MQQRGSINCGHSSRAFRRINRLDRDADQLFGRTAAQRDFVLLNTIFRVFPNFQEQPAAAMATSAQLPAGDRVLGPGTVSQQLLKPFQHRR